MGKETSSNTHLRTILIIVGILIVVIDSQITHIFSPLLEIQVIIIGIISLILLAIVLHRVRLSDKRKFDVGEKLTALVVGVFCVSVVFSDYYGILRFLLILFLALVGIPFLYLVIREEESADRGEINMHPDELTRMPYELVPDNIKNPVYSHPDVVRMKKRLQEKRKEYASSEDEEKQNQ